LTRRGPTRGRADAWKRGRHVFDVVACMCRCARRSRWAVCVCCKTNSAFLYAPSASGSQRSFFHSRLVSRLSGEVKYRGMPALVESSGALGLSLLPRDLPPQVHTLLVCTRSGAHVHTPRWRIPWWPATPRIFSLLKTVALQCNSLQSTGLCRPHTRTAPRAGKVRRSRLRPCSDFARHQSRGLSAPAAALLDTRREPMLTRRVAANTEHSRFTQGRATQCRSFHSRLSLAGTQAHTAARAKSSVGRFARVRTIGE
jgi:hypothetical protein